MSKSVDELIVDCQSLARTALEGCPAQTYALMASVIEEAIKLAPLMNQEYPLALEQIVKQLFEAQKIDDLIKIADFANFELVYILQNFSLN